MKLACISSVYGNKFHTVSEAWYEWNKKKMPSSVGFHLVSLDGEANNKLTSHVQYSFAGVNVKQRGLVWGDGDLPRLEKVIDLCSQGFTCIHMDLDVVLFKDISPVIELPSSFIISRAFGFPKQTVEKIGFVGCTGFYIAKPESLPLLTLWREKIKSHSQLDQLNINQILEEIKWNKEVKKVGDITYQNEVSSWEDVQVTVLDAEIMPRNNKNKNNRNFGIHNPKVMSDYWHLDR